MFGYFSTKGFKKYIRSAQRVLERNWTGAYTKPSPSLYPHQWNWDSGFIAMGYAHYNQVRAQQEILALFEAQWPSGMVPQIVFNRDALGNYFPEPNFWQVPEGRMTSGITMPPLHAIACLHIFEHATNRDKATAFLRKMFPKLLASHRYLYRYRDLFANGLVFIRHPWESGLDNSPAWDSPLKNIQIDRDNLPAYERKDLQKGVPAEQRPSSEDYDRYVYLVDLFRKHSYNEHEIASECPFLIQDVLFNAILCKADKDLVEIGRILGEDIGEVQEWAVQTDRAIREDLWCNHCRQFEAQDLVADLTIHAATAAGFMPLFSGSASQEQATILFERIDSISFCALKQGNCFTIPNYDMTKVDFDPKNYWRGPVWININWMLASGLKRYGFREKADAMKKDMIQLPLRFGFHEYFDSRSGQGYGSSNFSWTAALFLDLIYEYYDEDRHKFEWLNVSNPKKLGKARVLNNQNTEIHQVQLDLSGALMSSIGELRKQYYDQDRGRVNYDKISCSSEYRHYLKLAGGLQNIDLSAVSSDAEKLSFWINLYNVMVIHGIIELNITNSVREIPDFFQNICYWIDGQLYSLDDIEHGILRRNTRVPYKLLPKFLPWDSRKNHQLRRLDPRIHFALVCGSRSCAPIGFYDPSTVDEQLDLASSNFVNSSEVIVLPEKQTVYLSQIFLWYKRDFGGRWKILDFLIHYLHSEEKAEFLDKHRESITFEYLFYDWNLNH